MGKLTLLLLNIFIISLIFGQLGRIPLFEDIEGGVYVNDLVLTILVTSWLIWRLIVKKKFEINQIDFALGLFLAATFISLVFATDWLEPRQFVVPGLYWLRIGMYLSLFKIARDLVDEFGQDFRKLITWLGVTFAGLGLIQFFLFPDFSKYVEHGWDPHYYRVLSTFFDPNFAGLFLVLSFLFVLHQLYWKSSSIARMNLMMLLGLVLIGSATILTFSRSTYLAMAAGLGVFGWIKDKRILVIMVVLGLVIFATIPRVQTRVIGALNFDETASLRLVDYQQTLAIIRDNPIFGVGFNAFRYAQEDYGYFRDDRGVNQPSGHAGAGADNSFLFIQATGGILSLITLLVVLATIAFQSRKSKYKAFILAVLTALVVHSQFVNSLFYPWILAWVMIVFGIYLDNAVITNNNDADQ